MADRRRKGRGARRPLDQTGQTVASARRRWNELRAVTRGKRKASASASLARESVCSIPFATGGCQRAHQPVAPCAVMPAVMDAGGSGHGSGAKRAMLACVPTHVPTAGGTARTPKGGRRRSETSRVPFPPGALLPATLSNPASRIGWMEPPFDMAPVAEYATNGCPKRADSVWSAPRSVNGGLSGDRVARRAKHARPWE